MKNLQLILETKYFDMTKSRIKREDYRAVTGYWANRLLTYEGQVESRIFWEEMISGFGKSLLAIKGVKPKEFTKNIMTKGYPKAHDLDKILTYEHLGIEIHQGNPELGAESGVLYFVILHGEQLPNE